MKIKLITCLFLSILSNDFVLAVDNSSEQNKSKVNENNPFQKLKAEDLILHERIDNIQLIPGPVGESGSQGLAGENGKSCTVEQGNGNATIHCEDGTVAIVYDGQDTISLDESPPSITHDAPFIASNSPLIINFVITDDHEVSSYMVQDEQTRGSSKFYNV